MELSRAKVLVASDGEKTFAIVNGLLLVCSKFEICAESISGVRVSFSDSLLTPDLYKWSDFVDFVQNELGYNLTSGPEPEVN